jgi:hypothetical protein
MKAIVILVEHCATGMPLALRKIGPPAMIEPVMSQP